MQIRHRKSAFPANPLLLALCFFVTTQGSLAQDTRHVSEPRIPVSCSVLEAQLSAPGGVLSEADERRPDTARIQSAVNSCGAGLAVRLKASRGRGVFLTGPIELKAGVTLLIDADVALFGSRNPRDYDVTSGSCAIFEHNNGCKPLILADHAPGSGIMGDGVIDGRGGSKLFGVGKTWWEISHEAKVKDLTYSNSHILVIHASDNFTLYRITLRNSPNFHVGIEESNGFTAWGVKIDTPKTARNTDGINPMSATNISVLHSWIRAGDDNMAIKSTAAGPTAHLTIADDHFYHGHGMSIGSATSGGISDMLVRNLTIDGADNGIRIKSDRSRGGLVKNIAYQNVCIRNSPNPLIFNPYYTTFDGTKTPIYRDISLQNVHVLTSGNMIFAGLDAAHPLGITLDNVRVDGWKPEQLSARFAEIAIKSEGSNLSFPNDEKTSPDIKLNTTLRKDGPAQSPDACASASHQGAAGSFLPFPENTTAPQSKELIPPEDKTLYVAADGTGDFYTIQKAVDAAPANGALIMIGKGVYREIVVIDKPNIQLRSADPDPAKTIIVNDHNAGENGGTLHSATIEVHGDNFYAENITFENDFNKTHEQVSQGSQALAMLLVADRAVLRNVHLLGNQDTLYAASRPCAKDAAVCPTARAYFADCLIAGNVDFIFGDADAVFDHCEIRSTAHAAGGYLTAQSRNRAGQDSTYVFNHCTLTAEPGVQNVFLGRPWRPYAAVAFLNTEMGAHIAPAGWREWHPGETHSMETVTYMEFNSTGPGAHVKERDSHTKMLTEAEAAQFEAKRFLAGSDHWDPTVIR